MKPETSDGDPTQQAPEELLLKVEEEAALCVRRFNTIAERMQKDIDSLAIIATTMQRCVKRMELLKATMRPVPPIVEKDDYRLCAGERAIVSVLKCEGGPLAPIEIARRTAYAASSIRTWLPMLRQKGIIVFEQCQYDLVAVPPVNYRRAIESIPATPRA